MTREQPVCFDNSRVVALLPINRYCRSRPQGDSWWHDLDDRCDHAHLHPTVQLSYCKGVGGRVRYPSDLLSTDSAGALQKDSSPVNRMSVKAATFSTDITTWTKEVRFPPNQFPATTDVKRLASKRPLDISSTRYGSYQSLARRGDGLFCREVLCNPRLVWDPSAMVRSCAGPRQIGRVRARTRSGYRLVPFEGDVSDTTRSG